MHRLALALLLLGLSAAMLAPSAAAAEGLEIRRHGPACTPVGCAGLPRSPSTAALGFAAAVLATGVLARRGSHTPR